MINYIEKGIGLHDYIASLGLPPLEFVNGVWEHPTPEIVQPIIDSYDPLPDMRAKLHEEIANLRIEKQSKGVVYTFPDGVGTIQTRDTQDLININGLATRAVISPNATFQFRDQENVTHELTATQMGDLAQTAAEFVESLYAIKWAHDAAIDAWDNTEPYDINQFWPE